MSLICAFTVPCAAIPCSNFPIQGACINKLRHRRLQKFHHPILYISSKNFLQGVQSLDLSTLSKRRCTLCTNQKRGEESKARCIISSKEQISFKQWNWDRLIKLQQKNNTCSTVRKFSWKCFFSIKSTMWTIFCNLSHCFHKETNLGWDVFMRGSGT
jgi:hypothetical protein